VALKGAHQLPLTRPLPVMRPQLPATERLLPYLSRIDQSRIYSNFGPLTAEFEDRLAAHFALPGGAVTTVANATLGLTLALSAQGARPATLCLMPAWTFVASAQAAVAAGLVPFFVDVDPEAWTLDPATVAATIASAPGDVGAVMPVMPFGRPIDFAAWDRFRSTSGIPVVIDAAAGFDAVKGTATPAVVSLHATKALGVGEGGLVLSRDAALVREIRTRSSFGFDGSREARMPAMNAKLSEYHAAVGLAALDEWPAARTAWYVLAGTYRKQLLDRRTPAHLPAGFGEEWVSSVCVLSLRDLDGGQAETRLQQAGIESRRWWGTGAHAHAATRHHPRTALPITQEAARSTIGVPFFRDMAGADVERVVEAIGTERERASGSGDVDDQAFPAVKG
jgi:dTDP-4-amino-4,6-dideoxygalactose transaminase